MSLAMELHGLKLSESIQSLGFHSLPAMTKSKPIEPIASDVTVKEIAERIVRLRKQRGITQVQLADALGLRQSMVSRLEKGDYRLNGEAIITIAKLYKVSADEILGLKSYQQDQTNISRRWLKRLVKIERLPKRDQDGLIQTVDRYLKASDTL